MEAQDTFTQPQQPQPAQGQPEPVQVVAQPESEKTLYSWKSPSRVYKKRNREFYSTIAALIILLSVILLFAKEFLLIAVIMSLGFVSYVLASVEPHTVAHTLTNKGVRTHNKLYLWAAVSRYWWEKKWNQETLHLEVPGQFPSNIVMLLGQGDKKSIEGIVSKYSVKDKPAPTWIDNATKWLQEKVPLEAQDAPRKRPRTPKA